ESCFSSYGRSAIGAKIDLTEHARLSGLADSTALLFAESPSRIVLSVKSENVDQVKEIAAEIGAIVAVIGEVAGNNLAITLSGETLANDSVADLERFWNGALPKSLERPLPTSEG
ncbi:MAG: hypothetical protein JNK38_21905, partial [Acidobacteria bacterium]|nr:hypothetical protein [Acidobacteriota bacterium]